MISSILQYSLTMTHKYKSKSRVGSPQHYTKTTCVHVGALIIHTSDQYVDQRVCVFTYLFDSTGNTAGTVN